ncbi:MAG: FAD-dependent oxidoreductase [Eubacteriales bacterium]
MKDYDKIIIGAGIYGLYAAKFCVEKGDKVLVLEYDSEAVSRATYINQARVHNGYHYPRSYSTAIKSANYFRRFNEDFNFAVNKQFTKIYATSKEYSWTSEKQFEKFCEAANIRCEKINYRQYFNKGLVDGAFETEEYTFDAMEIKKYFLDSIKGKVEIIYNAKIDSVEETNDRLYKVILKDGTEHAAPYVLNATYASTNQISHLMGFQMFNIKYELCEIILCKTSKNIENIGITVMDGPFFSVMPFGLTGDHSLTSVTFTPHISSSESLPAFSCQSRCECSPVQLSNCNLCDYKPKSAWEYMYRLAKKYLKNDIDIFYKGSLFSIKPILKASEIDDSRPTVIRIHNESPKFVSVLSGKINTVYDLDEVL